MLQDIKNVQLSSIEFDEVRSLDDVAKNILQKRYYHQGESSWEDVTSRVVNWVVPEGAWWKETARQMILNRYFLPNSPCLVNSGKKGGGLSACFVVGFEDSIEEIYKTKLEFALIAKKGGGCGTTLSNLRPENDFVAGSTHGYAGGPVKFFETICNDMKAMTQAGFREMAMMGTMIYTHPDIIKFIKAKTEEGRMHTTNISVLVDSRFMELVKSDGEYWTEFGGKRYDLVKARDIFDMIVNGAWNNGEPGLIFIDRMNNNSPYGIIHQKIESVNPCGEQPLPKNGVCNLGSLDLSKFVIDNQIDWAKLEVATRIAVRILDAVIDAGSYPTRDIHDWAHAHRPVGVGVMGVADMLLDMEIAYGSRESMTVVGNVMRFIQEASESESVIIGQELGIPEGCKSLPVPRRNITVQTVAPTGTISLIAGCSNGIEPVFSEFTMRTDKTGTYKIYHPKAHESYFRCAVTGNGGTEVTWQEHVAMQNEVQKYVDSGVSKTINFPNSATREDIASAFMMAYDLGSVKGMTVYRNGSRSQEVLSPKKINKDMACPECGGTLVKEGGCTHCDKCEYSFCEVG